MKNVNILILLSGGIDSAACAYFYKKRRYSVKTLFIDYGQVAAQYEDNAAGAIAKHLNIPHKRISLMGNRKNKLDGEILGRNMFLISTALMEFEYESGLIATGIHSGTSYFDCSKEFFDYIQKIVVNSTNGCIKIEAPFLTWGKNDILNYFIETRIPFSLTYSCEKGLQPTCGSCLSCRDLEKFYVSPKLKDNS